MGSRQSVDDIRWLMYTSSNLNELEDMDLLYHQCTIKE